MTNFEVSIISRKFIKPSSPTPPELQILRLSLMDQFFSPGYSSLIYFYPNTPRNGDDAGSSYVSKRYLLENSLSETLVRFYPMAGRLKAGSFIDCSDEGAMLLEAQIGCSLRDFLSPPEANLLTQFIPSNDPANTQLAPGCVLFIQLTLFSCGGLAICANPSHVIGDASSLCTFIKAWTATARGDVALVRPIFIGGSLLPPVDSPLTITSPARNILTGKCVTRRFVFSGSTINALRSKVVNALGKHKPSRVAIVLSLILKCAISAASQSTSGSFRTSVLFQLADFRKKLEPPLPENAMGNHILFYPLLFNSQDLDLCDMVAKMRRGLMHFRSEKLSKIQGSEGTLVVGESIRERYRLMKNTGIVIYKSSSACGVPIYDVDFGWGEPIWVTGLIYYSNQILLLDTKVGGGIEAWITLEEQEMALFERDQEILEFASLNPNVFVPRSRM